MLPSRSSNDFVSSFIAKIRARMRLRLSRVSISVAATLMLASLPSQSFQIKTHPEITQLVGDWHGKSMCQVKPSACQDEKVVYHFSNPHDGKITIEADKIVDNKPITMGSSEWTYDSKSGLLTWNTPRGQWSSSLDMTRSTAPSPSRITCCFERSICSEQSDSFSRIPNWNSQ